MLGEREKNNDAGEWNKNQVFPERERDKGKRESQQPIQTRPRLSLLDIGKIKELRLRNAEMLEDDR